MNTLTGVDVIGFRTYVVDPRRDNREDGKEYCKYSTPTERVRAKARECCKPLAIVAAP